MKKSIKSLFIFCLALCSLLCVAFTGLSLSTNVASASAGTGLSLGGVYIRIPQADETDGYGIRFSATISKTQYDANAEGEATVVYGMQVRPADDVADVKDQTVNAVDFEGDVGSFYCSIVNLRDYNLSRPYQARAYYKVNDNEPVYTDWGAAKSIYTVATQALTDTSKLADTDVTELNEMVNFVQGNNTYENKYVINSFTIDTGAKAKDELADGDIITINATVKNDADATRVLPVYPVPAITTNSGGYKEDVTLTLVNGTSNQYELNATKSIVFGIDLTLGTGDYALTESLTGFAVKAGEAIKISSAQDMTDKVLNATNGWFELTADITLSGTWSPTAASNNYFEGVFDGNGYSISGLKTSGLFYSLRGTVKNLAINRATLTGTAGVVSMFLDGGTIDNVYASVSMTGAGLSGGFAQQVRKPSTISNSVVQITSSSNINAQSGLIVGRGYDTLTLTNTYAIKPAGCDKKLVGTYGDAGSSWATFRDTVNALDTTANPVSYSLTDFANDIKDDKINVNIAMLKKVSVIIVSTADELVAAFKEATQNEKRYASIVLTADIDMSKQTGGNKALSPIAVFSGTFDGNGHSISNLILKYGGGNGTGMFTQLNEGTVKNVALLNVSYDSTIDTTKSYTATIAGGIRGATVDNVYVSVDVSGAGNYSAGIAGWVNSSNAGLKITNCVVVITTNAGDTTQGGLIGKGSKASPADFSGSYIVTEATTLNAMGDVGSVSITANESGKYTLANFKTAGIDFSGYNVAVSSNVAKLIAE